MKLYIKRHYAIDIGVYLKKNSKNLISILIVCHNLRVILIVLYSLFFFTLKFSHEDFEYLKKYFQFH